MEYEKIKLPASLGMAVSKYLMNERGREPQVNEYGLIEFKFLPEELEMVKKVELSNVKKDALEKIKHLKNLETLIISNEDGHHENLEEIEAHESEEYSIEDRDFMDIAKCENIKHLTIIAQNKLKTIDLNYFKNLQYLELRCNKNLEEICSGRDIDKLETFICCDNEKLKNTEEIGRIIERNLKLTRLRMDVMNFPDVIGYDYHNGEYNKEIMDRLKKMGEVQFEECFEADRIIRLKLEEMIKMHNKACKILHLYVQDTANKKDVIVGIDNYLAQNVTYDEKAATHVHVDMNENDCEENEKAFRFVKAPSHGASGAFNAIVYNQCICEGYTRAMQYLLKLKGIKSHDVYCRPKVREKSFFNTEEENAQVGQYKIMFEDEYHSILCVDDFYSLYVDACLDAKFYKKGDKTFPFLLKTKEQIEETHKFVSSQEDVMNRYSEQSDQSIMNSIRNTELHIENKMRTGGDKEEIRGIIV